LKTEQNEIIIEYNYDNYQKVNLIIFIITILGIVIFLLQQTFSLLLLGFITFFSLIIIFSIIALFSKNGLVVKNKELYIADFFLTKLLHKRKVKFTDKSAFSILKLRKKQKTVMTVSNPDSSYRLISYDIYLLNDKHTKKQYLMSLRNENDSKNASEFISTYSNFKYEIYSPDFR